METRVLMGDLPRTWEGLSGNPRTITFSVTEDCNLACKYCYMTGKNHTKKMSFETAKKSVDYILGHPELFPEDSIIWDFIGGEPFLEIDLITKICDYIKQQMFLLDHPWFHSYRFSFSSNGLLYHTEAVQHFIACNRKHLSIGLSVDGNKIKHDLQRVRLDGSGSYDDVVKNVPLWLQQFPHASTKATFAHDDLPYLKDSIISLWDIGIKNIAANVVFEDVWQDGDDVIFEQQLRELADYVLENEKWRDCTVRFFNPTIGQKLSADELHRNFCGGGSAMLAIDCDGNFSPCVRFLSVSLNHKPPIYIGNAEEGLNKNKLRPFLALDVESQSLPECTTCEVASGCSWCQGCNYDLADTDTIYQRAIYHCKMHKANVRANIYFWNKFERVTGLPSKRRDFITTQTDDYYMQFITSDDVISHCGYRSTKEHKEVMTKEMFQKGLDFCEQNSFTPVMLGTVPGITDEREFFVIDRVGNANNSISIYENSAQESDSAQIANLLIDKEHVGQLLELLKRLYVHKSRVNLELENIDEWTEDTLGEYEKELDRVVAYLEEEYRKYNRLELNVIHDLWNTTSMQNCDAGNTTFSLAPNGKLYICPAFYFHNPDDSVGNLDTGLDIKNARLLDVKNAPICKSCDVYHCNRCKFLNKKLTNEFNTPSEIQCFVNHIQRNASMKMQKRLIERNGETFINEIEPIEYSDPLEVLMKRKGKL